MTLKISNPDAEELEETLRLAFGHLPENELPIRIDAVLNQYRSGNLSLDGIFQAKINGQRIGVLFSQQRADGVVTAWTPVMREGFSIKPFFEPFEIFCRQHQAVAVLFLADIGQRIEEKTLSAGQFEPLSDLVCLAVPVIKEKIVSETSLRFFPMSESRSETEAFERMVAVVHATYRNTKDFPQLIPLIPVDRVLYGYQTAAGFLPELWFFVKKK
jgi:hypothetical protein